MKQLSDLRFDQDAGQEYHRWLATSNSGYKKTEPGCSCTDPDSPVVGRSTSAHDRRGRLVGLHHYHVEKDLLRSVCTWVAPSWRRYGLARALWGRSLTRTCPRRVSVYTVTKKSTRMCLKFKRIWPRIDWDVIADHPEWLT